ncbi:MAG: hypothetical protein V4662_11860 [Verrucomicrobiota bacterium]
MSAPKKKAGALVATVATSAQLDEIELGNPVRALASPGGLRTLEVVAVIRWLEAALPVYERSRGTLARQAVMIGYALICVRDHCPRGSLAELKKMQVFQRSARSLDRCIKAAMHYAQSRGLITQGKLQEPQEAATFFHPEFDFSDPKAHPLSLDIAEYVGDATLKDLVEKDALEVDENEPPQDHQDTSAKNRAVKETAEQKRAAYSAGFAKWHVMHGAGKWKALYLHGDPKQKRLGTLDVEEILKAALEEVQAHNKAEAAKEKRKA